MCAGHPDLHAICTRVLDCARTRPCARPHLHPCLRACPRLRPRPSLAHTNVHVRTMPAPTTMQAMGARTTHTTGIAHPCVHCTCAHKLVASMDMCVCVCVCVCTKPDMWLDMCQYMPGSTRSTSTCYSHPGLPAGRVSMRMVGYEWLYTCCIRRRTHVYAQVCMHVAVPLCRCACVSACEPARLPASISSKAVPAQVSALCK